MAVAELRLPPHSVPAEQAVLGALLLEPKAWPLVSRILDASDFYRPDHRLLYATIARMAARNAHADAVTAGAELETRGELEAVGGQAWLFSLVRNTATADTVEHYAAAVRERAQLRKLGDVARNLESLALGQSGESAETIAAQIASQLAAIQSRAQTGTGLVRIEDIAKELVDDLDARREGKRKGLATGLADFDWLTGGLEPGDLVLLAGRPATGKTSLLGTIAAHVSRDVWVSIFSAEMPKLQLARRMTAFLGGIAQDKLRRPERMTDDDWAHATEGMSLMSRRHIAIDDRHLPSLEHIRAECMGFRARYGMGLVLIDYAQLVQAPGKNMHESMGKVAYGAKALAKELECPVVMLAQLNRDVERRDNRRPRMSDLRESGSLEEAADIIGMLYREGYYDETFDMPYAVECNVEKARNSERGQCLWRFDGEFSRMMALDDSERRRYRHLVSGRKSADTA